jgi:hypothetical protein
MADRDTYLYQGEVPEPDTVLDMGRQLLVATTVSDDALDEVLCASMLDAVAALYVGSLQHHREQEARICDSAQHAERIYLDAAQGAYLKAIRRDYPNYDADPEAMMWPEAMRYREGWPYTFVVALGKTLGEIEGERSVAVFRWVAKQEQQKGASQ